MFGKTLLLANLCTALVLCSIFGLTSAAPVRREETEYALYGRDLQPLTPASQIQPVMVDLLDQYRNLAEQVASSTKGTPEFDVLVAKMNSTKAALEEAIAGVAVFVPDPVTSSANATSTTATATTTEVASATITSANTTSTPTSSESTSTPSSSASSTSSGTPSSTITNAPTATVDTNVPVVTIVTQVGTSIVVVASQGVTSTITLATRTAISTSATSNGAATSATPTSSRATSTFDINTVPAPGTEPTTSSAPGTAVNSSQNQIDNGALSLAPTLWSGSMLIVGLVGALIAL